MRTISIRLDERTDALLRAFCECNGINQTDAVKAAIELLAQLDRPTPAELAVLAVLIGSFHSTEGDLAENHSQRLKQRLRAKLRRDAIPSVSTASGA